MGASRIVKGKAIPHPVGDPSQSYEGEKELRKEMLKKALEALETKVASPTVFST